MARKYVAYVVQREHGAERFVGEYTRLSKALLDARGMCREYGREWDWVVDTYKDGAQISRRSSIAGFEPFV